MLEVPSAARWCRCGGPEPRGCRRAFDGGTALPKAAEPFHFMIRLQHACLFPHPTQAVKGSKGGNPALVSLPPPCLPGFSPDPLCILILTIICCAISSFYFPCTVIFISTVCVALFSVAPPERYCRWSHSAATLAAVTAADMQGSPPPRALRRRCAWSQMPAASPCLGACEVHKALLCLLVSLVQPTSVGCLVCLAQFAGRQREHTISLSLLPTTRLLSQAAEP